jgi:hypothetical protein
MFNVLKVSAMKSQTTIPVFLLAAFLLAIASSCAKKTASCCADASSLQSGPVGKAANSSGIPDRPEKLSFPPLTYEPPAQSTYRVPL